jgi:hypothetical protein
MIVHKIWILTKHYGGNDVSISLYETWHQAIKEAQVLAANALEDHPSEIYKQDVVRTIAAWWRSHNHEGSVRVNEHLSLQLSVSEVMPATAAELYGVYNG